MTASSHPHVFDQGPPLYADVPVVLRAQDAERRGVPLRGGFFNSLPGIPANNPRRRNSFRARSAGGGSFPPEVQELFAGKCAPSCVTLLPRGLNQNIRPNGVYLPERASLSFFVDESVTSQCAEQFRALLDSGHEPFLDYAHLGPKYRAALVRDIFHSPSRGTCAAVDWEPWASQEIMARSCCSFSPVFFVSDDSLLEFVGIDANVGALLHRSTEPGLPRLRNSIQPVTLLEDLVFRASYFKRRLGELQRMGDHTAADAEQNLARQMPSFHAAYLSYAGLEQKFGPDFYLPPK